MIKANSFVRIKKVILSADERTANIPSDTKQTDLVMWVKGYLNADAKIDDIVSITTVTGRIEEGVLVAYNHTYDLGYGEYIEELNMIGPYLWKKLYG